MPTTLRLRVIACLAILGPIGHGSMSLGQDLPPAQAVAIKKAEADYLRARLARVEAEVALETYASTTLPGEVAALEAETALARAELERARWRLAWAEHMVENGYAPPSRKLLARLLMDKARINLEKAETEQAILERYTKIKTLHELRGEVEKAKPLEASREAAYELARTKRAD